MDTGSQTTSDLPTGGPNQSTSVLISVQHPYKDAERTSSIRRELRANTDEMNLDLRLDKSFNRSLSPVLQSSESIFALEEAIKTDHRRQFWSSIMSTLFPEKRTSLERHLSAYTAHLRAAFTAINDQSESSIKPKVLTEDNMRQVVPHMQFLSTSGNDPVVNMQLNRSSSEEVAGNKPKNDESDDFNICSSTRHQTSLLRSRSHLAISMTTQECTCLADPDALTWFAIDYTDVKPRRFIKKDVWMATNTVREKAPVLQPNRPSVFRWAVPFTPYTTTIPDYAGSGLNYFEITKILNSEVSNRRAVLLQALRWRITKPAAAVRDAFIAEVIHCDLLGLRGKCSTAVRLEKLLWPLSQSQPSKITDAVARLLNALCSCPAGLDYVAAHSVVSLLVWGVPLHGAAHFRPRRDPIAETTAENLIGCMHKLAQHDGQRKDMLHKGLVVWLLRHLYDIEQSASVYHIENALGLLRLMCSHTSYRPGDYLDVRHSLAMLARYLHSGLAVCREHVRAILLALMQQPGLAAKTKVLQYDRIIERLQNACAKEGREHAEYGMILAVLRKTNRVRSRSMPVHGQSLRRPFTGVMDPQIEDNDPIVAAGLNGEKLLQKMFTLTTRHQATHL